MPPKQSDLRRRTALDTGQLARPAGSGARDGGSGSAADDNATAETVLDELHDQLNARIDADVETLAKGALSLVSLAEVPSGPNKTGPPLTNEQIGEKDTFKVAQDAFEADARAETMVRSRPGPLMPTR
jgi:mediator of RNA polymerase II transcription subunit 22